GADGSPARPGDPRTCGVCGEVGEASFQKMTAGQKTGTSEIVCRRSGGAVSRLQQNILIVSTVLGSWLGMQAVHESGHVLGASLTGGEVARVVLHPLTISRTDLAHNPSPLPVVWAGPVVGVLAPLAIWGIAAGLRMPGAFVL